MTVREGSKGSTKATDITDHIVRTPIEIEYIGFPKLSPTEGERVFQRLVEDRTWRMIRSSKDGSNFQIKNRHNRCVDIKDLIDRCIQEGYKMDIQIQHYNNAVKKLDPDRPDLLYEI